MKESENLDYFVDMLRKDPESKAFAPLAEGYRRQGLLEKALQVAMDGVALHPNFSSGKVALARILIDLKKLSSAKSILTEVLDSDHENLLAHRLMGELEIKMENYAQALNSYKNALLINPMDKKSQIMVNKLESFSIEGFEDGVFFEKDLSKTFKEQSMRGKVSLKACLSYVDALIRKNSYSSALNYISTSITQFPNNQEILKRKKYLESLKDIGQNKPSKNQILTKPEETKLKISSLLKAIESIETQLKTRPELYKES